jgi:hypothetical protein
MEVEGVSTPLDEWAALRADLQARINAEELRRRHGRGSICDEKLARWRKTRDQADEKIRRLMSTGTIAATK